MPEYLKSADRDGIPGVISNEATRFRDDFPGSAVDLTKWDVVGSGASVAAGSSLLTIASGVVANAATQLTGKVGFQLPARAQFVAMLSQRIANTDVYFELVNSAGDTRASWRFTGTSATAANVESTSAGAQATGSASITAIGTASFSLFELDARDDGVDWNERVPEASSAVSTRATRTRTTLVPGETYFPRIRVVNGVTAPASSTLVSVESVFVQAQARQVVEVAGGRGQPIASEGIPVLGVGGSFAVSSGNIGLRPVSTQTDETTTALGASGVYSGTTRDLGSDVSTRPTRIRWTYLATAAALGSVAHLFLDESSDGTTWRTTQQTPLPTDAGYHTGEWSLGHLRYYRFRVVNGATAQTALFLSAILVRGDGSTADTKANLPFPLTPVAGSALALSATFTGPVLDLGANHQWDRARLYVFGDQATSACAVQFSADGTSGWGNAPSFSTAANGAGVGEFLVVSRYARPIVVNSATAQTALRALVSLVTL